MASSVKRAAITFAVLDELQCPPRPWADTKAYVAHLRTCENCCMNLAARVHTKLTATSAAATATTETA